jgi:hypothetical protein
MSSPSIFEVIFETLKSSFPQKLKPPLFLLQSIFVGKITFSGWGARVIWCGYFLKPDKQAFTQTRFQGLTPHQSKVTAVTKISSKIEGRHVLIECKSLSQSWPWYRLKPANLRFRAHEEDPLSKPAMAVAVTQETEKKDEAPRYALNSVVHRHQPGKYIKYMTF